MSDIKDKLGFLTSIFVIQEEGASTGNQSAVPNQPNIAQELLRNYEKVFLEANLTGVDFFEFYAAVAKQPNQNATAYQMAYGMVTGMNSETSVASLAGNAEFYLGKIEETAQAYLKQQEEIRSKALADATNEKRSFIASADAANKEIEKLEAQLAAEREKFRLANESASKVDATFAGQLSQVDANLAANETAKAEMAKRINEVLENLKKFVPA